MQSMIIQPLQTLKHGLKKNGNRLLSGIESMMQQPKWSWKLAFLMVTLGLINALSFAPYASGMLWFLSFGVLVLALFQCVEYVRVWRAVGLVLLFYVPHFMLGLNWLVISMHVYGGLPSVLAWLALLLFALYLSSFYALMAAVLVRFLARMRQTLKTTDSHSTKKILSTDLFGYFVLFPMVWLMADVLRGYVLTGFPWLLAGYAHIQNPFLISFAPIVGVYGIGLLAYWLVGCALFLWQSETSANSFNQGGNNKIKSTENRDSTNVQRGFQATPTPQSGCLQRFQSKKQNEASAAAKRAVLACMAVVLIAGLGLSVMSDYWRRDNPVRPRHLFTKPADTPINVALIQGNIEQSVKFDPQYFEQSYQSYLSLMNTPQAAQVDLMVLPETVFPIPWQSTPVVFKEALLKKAQNSALIFGAVWQHETLNPNSSNSSNEVVQYSNAALTFNRQASEPSAVFHKIHLVPFGEITPDMFAWFAKVLKIPYGSFYQGSTDQLPSQIKQTNIWLNICYEVLFGEELAQRLRQNTDQNAPNILLNLSNYGWFGDGLVMSQVSNIMLMRAHEFEFPLLAATNTGPTNFFDKNEINLLKNDQKISNVVIKEVFPYFGKTGYLLLGNFVLLLIMMLIIVAFFCICTKNCIKNTKQV
jgi:apolipoprotein N-acyltransferase